MWTNQGKEALRPRPCYRTEEWGFNGKESSVLLFDEPVRCFKLQKPSEFHTNDLIAF